MKRIAIGLLSIVFVAAAVAGMSSFGYGFEAKTQLNINTATAEELAEVPGIDMELARNIIAYRNINGPFPAVDDLMKVKGMDEKKLEEIRMYLSVTTQPKLE